MTEYDLQSPYDLAIMNSEFDMLTADDWEEYAEHAERFNMSYKSINALKSAMKKAGISKYVSSKMVRWCVSLVEEIDAKLEAEEGEEA